MVAEPGGTRRMTPRDQVAGIAEHFKRLRMASGLSSQQIADGAGISDRCVMEVERGWKHGPRFLTVAKLAKFYGVSLDQIGAPQ